MNSEELIEINDDLDVLIAKYPVVFKNMDMSSYSFIPKGWVERVDKLCADLTVLLEEHLKNNTYKPDEYPFTVLQIKEKFGGLRFYFTTFCEDHEFHKQICKLVDRAEDETYSICEVTGKPGKLCKKGSHYKTLCEVIQLKEGFTVLGNGNS